MREARELSIETTNSSYTGEKLRRCACKEETLCALRQGKINPPPRPRPGTMLRRCLGSSRAGIPFGHHLKYIFYKFRYSSPYYVLKYE
jgi:hypothetical protein